MNITERPSPQIEPFGYFKAEPFGWTDCAEDDEGAVALYDAPQAPHILGPLHTGMRVVKEQGA